MFSVTVKIEGKDDQTVEVEDEEKVKEAIQQLNGMKSMALDEFTVTITDEDGNERDPHEFGLPRKDRFDNKLANAVDKVIQTEGSRDSFEWLLEHMAMKHYDTYDIMEAMELVFGEVDTAINNDAIAEYDLKDEKVVQAKENNKLSKEEFLAALAAGAE